MKNVLCILSKSAQDSQAYDFLFSQDENLKHTTVVLIGDAVGQNPPLANQVYYVTEENERDGQNSVSYMDLLNLIFSSERSFVV